MYNHQLPTPVPGHVGHPYGTLAEQVGESKLVMRRRLNIVAVCEMIFIPWLLFTVVYSLMSFGFHSRYPEITYVLAFLCLACVLAVGRQATRSRQRSSLGEAGAPTWLHFLFAALLVAWCLAMVLGELNYGVNGTHLYSTEALNTYRAVSPAQSNGLQLMDAGMVHFEKDARIDVSKSLGFKHHDQYCVAPIVSGDAPLSTYDFWVVGKNCCSGVRPDFRCGEFRNPDAHAGRRVTKDDDQEYFRMAVQQAVATHKIRASHPLLFYWEVDPTSKLQSYRASSFHLYILGIWAHFALNLLCVVVATVYYAKIGYRY